MDLLKPRWMSRFNLSTEGTWISWVPSLTIIAKLRQTQSNLAMAISRASRVEPFVEPPETGICSHDCI